MRLCSLVLLVATLGAQACVGSGPPQSTVHTLELPAPPSPVAPRVPASILSAHFAQDNVPSLEGADVLSVVFSVELDASTVVAEHFVIAREDGTRARPKLALLSPANESDENRTVLLLGDFGGPDDRPATNIAVSGAVYSEAGESLRGLAAAVLAFETPPTVVFAEQLPPRQGRCAGAASMIRTYWTEGLRDLDPKALARLEISTEAGVNAHPSAVDDQASPGQDGADDNVLDLCLKAAVRPVRLRLPAGVLKDAAGHANEAVDVDVASGAG